MVIATSGRPRLLERTLASLEQCIKPGSFRGVHVIENGDQAGAEEIVSRYHDSIPATYHHTAAANKSNALNIVLKDLDGDDLAIFADDDVRFDPGHLAAYSRGLESHSGAYFGGPLAVDFEGDRPPRWLEGYLPYSVMGWNPGTAELESVRYFVGGNWAMQLRDWKEAGGFSPLFGPGGTINSTGQESDMQTRLQRLGLKSVYLPDARAWHFVPSSRCSEEWALDRVARQAIYAGYHNSYNKAWASGTPLRIRIRATLRAVRRRRLWRPSSLQETRFKFRFARESIRGFIEGARLKPQACRQAIAPNDAGGNLKQWLLVLVLIGLSATLATAAKDTREPFRVEFLKSARWTEGHEGFDPELSGYHITGDIAGVILDPRTNRLPGKLVLAITTSPGMRPNLEGFFVTGTNLAIETALSDGLDYSTVKNPGAGTRSSVKKGTYLQFRVVDKAVHVTFLPRAMPLLEKKCKIFWIDWYRE
jgi:GT2 family glycosyltransferase